ncbi:MAG: SapC family protein, partial [Burkholderiaceae bacterium]
MFQKVVPINRERHASKKIKQASGFGFASGFHLAYVTIHEFARAAAIYPIVFLEDKEADEFRPVVLLGLEAGENLFVGTDGKWQASYVPAIIRRYPFALSRTDEQDRFTICIDEDSELVNDAEGAALFDDKGEPTEVSENSAPWAGILSSRSRRTWLLIRRISRRISSTLSRRPVSSSRVSMRSAT